MSPQDRGSTTDSFAAIAADLGLQHPVVTRLHGGLSNQAWRLCDARQDLVLRKAGAAGELLGADRRSEFAMQEMAAAAGLAPSIVLMRPADGILVTRYVEGRVPTRDEFREPGMLARIGAWFAKLHALAPPQGLPTIDFGARAAGYLEVLRGKQPSSMLYELERGLAARRRSLPPLQRFVACHHDLHHLNVVDRGDALLALDWEYAGPGDPAADLAACAGYHDLEAERVESLLGGYGEGVQPLLARLAPLGWIFDCLWLGWIEISAQHGDVTDDARRQRLIARLLP